MIDKGMDKGVAFLSDHPTLASRVQTANQRARELGPDAERWARAPVASPSEFRRLQARAQELARSMPDDKSLAQTQELLQALPRSCLTPAVQEDQVRARDDLQRKLRAAEQRGRSGSSVSSSSAASSGASPSDVVSSPPRRHRTPPGDE
jgi:hypothetical protein